MKKQGLPIAKKNLENIEYSSKECGIHVVKCAKIKKGKHWQLLGPNALPNIKRCLICQKWQYGASSITKCMTSPMTACCNGHITDILWTTDNEWIGGRIMFGHVYRYSLMPLNEICTCLQFTENTYSTYDLAKARWYIWEVLYSFRNSFPWSTLMACSCFPCVPRQVKYCLTLGEVSSFPLREIIVMKGVVPSTNMR